MKCKKIKGSASWTRAIGFADFDGSDQWHAQKALLDGDGESLLIFSSDGPCVMELNSDPIDVARFDAGLFKGQLGGHGEVVGGV